MISQIRCVAFLCVPDYLLASEEAGHQAVRPGLESGRHAASRVGAAVPRLLPGAPSAGGGSALIPAVAVDGTVHTFPVQPRVPAGRNGWFSPTASGLAVSTARSRGGYKALPEIYRAVTPAVEEVAPGAAYIDLSGLEPLHGEPVRQIAQHVVDRATWELGLPLVGGLARNKVLACLAARHARPGQVFELAKDQEQQFLDAEPLGALPGMGRPAVTLLRDYGVGTVGDFGRLSEGAVVRLLGARARRLLAWARGEDSRPVRAGDRSDVEQSAAVTFPRDTLDYTAIVEAAHSLTDQLLFRVRRQSRLARVVWVRVTHSDLQEARTLCHLGHSTSLYPEVHRAVDDLLRCVLARRVRIRQLEIGLGRFVADQRQQSLFPNRRDRLAQLCWSVDEVWSKHGRIVLFGDDPSLRRGWV